MQILAKSLVVVVVVAAVVEASTIPRVKDFDEGVPVHEVSEEERRLCRPLQRELLHPHFRVELAKRTKDPPCDVSFSF